MGHFVLYTYHNLWWVWSSNITQGVWSDVYLNMIKKIELVLSSFISDLNSCLCHFKCAFVWRDIGR